MSVKFIVPSEMEFSDKGILIYEGQFDSNDIFRVTVPIGTQITHTNYDHVSALEHFASQNWVVLK